MGRPKVKIIDDSQAEPEIKNKQSLRSKDLQRSKIKNSNKEEQIKPEAAETIDEVVAAPETKIEDKQVGKTEDQSERSLPKKTQKPGKAKPRSKKYQEITKDLDRNKAYPLNEAIDLSKKISYSKFNATIEAHINTTQTGIRGFISLPYGSGKKLRILAFGKGAEESGADLVGTDSSIEEINKGKIDFDLVITSPEWMPKFAKVARILGPRGLMPNPKTGTITTDLKKAVESYQAGKTEYKTEPKAAVIHLALGKIDQPTPEINANIKALIQTMGKTRIKKITLSPTMGPGVKVDLSSL